MTDISCEYQPTIFINHGGGPLPLLGRQPAIARSLQKLSSNLTRPRAIVIISAHFESPGDTVSIMTAERPGMLYDYYGFPAESYRLKYPAVTDTKLAARVVQMLTFANLKVKTDEQRGFDHGVFVPLLIMFPKADIPLVVISVPVSGKPSVLTKIGHAIGSLSRENILILGSGASFHNFSAFSRPSDDILGRATDASRAAKWDAWLQTSVLLNDPEKRMKLLEMWGQAPHATFAHPSHEHLSPLLVVAAAAEARAGKLLDGSLPEAGSLHGSQFVFGGLSSVSAQTGMQSHTSF